MFSETERLSAVKLKTKLYIVSKQTSVLHDLIVNLIKLTESFSSEIKQKVIKKNSTQKFVLVRIVKYISENQSIKMFVLLKG